MRHTKTPRHTITRQLESLEPRLLLTTYTWTGNAHDGLLATAANWNTHTSPLNDPSADLVFGRVAVPPDLAYPAFVGYVYNQTISLEGRSVFVHSLYFDHTNLAGSGPNTGYIFTTGVFTLAHINAVDSTVTFNVTINANDEFFQLGSQTTFSWFSTFQTVINGGPTHFGSSISVQEGLATRSGIYNLGGAFNYADAPVAPALLSDFHADAGVFTAALVGNQNVSFYGATTGAVPNVIVTSPGLFSPPAPTMVTATFKSFYLGSQASLNAAIYSAAIYSKAISQGPVSIDGAALNVSNILYSAASSEPGNAPLTLIDNQSASPILGHFKLASGTVLNEGDLLGSYRISYVGGDGNDFTLTPVANPTVNLSVNAATLAQGKNLQITVAIAGGPADANVQFLIDDQVVSIQTVHPTPGLPGQFTAELTLSQFSPGTHTLLARYTSYPPNFMVETTPLAFTITGNIPLNLFNEAYYLQANPDVAAAVAAGQFDSGLDHFIHFGNREWRNPSPLFDQTWYLEHNPDVADGIASDQFNSPFDHFLQFGNREGRDPSANFNSAYYLLNNWDVAQAFLAGKILSAFDHYTRFGYHEQPRNPVSTFNEAGYLKANPDVAAAVNHGDLLSGYDHYLRYGQHEGRNPLGL